MEDRLIVIDDLSSVLPNKKGKKVKLKEYILNGIKFCCSFLILRLIFVLPIFIFSNNNTTFFHVYSERCTYYSPSYDKIWNDFKNAFYNVLENNNYLIKYMIVSFIIISIILMVLIKSPISILISFILVAISPYLIKNIFLPVISFFYLPINFICLFIDKLIPSCIPILLVWAVGGFLAGVVRKMVTSSQ